MKFRSVALKVKSFLSPQDFETRSEQQLANLFGPHHDSLGLFRMATRGINLKTSHLPEDMGEGELCNDCPGAPEHPRYNCREVKIILIEKARTRKKFPNAKFHW